MRRPRAASCAASPRSGDIAGARKTFRALSAALKEELGGAGVPSAETRTLLAELAGSAARG